MREIPCSNFFPVRILTNDEITYKYPVFFIMLSKLACLIIIGVTRCADVPPTPSKDLAANAPLGIDVLVNPPEDCKRVAAKNDDISVHYTGWLLADGSKFDSSRDRGQPFKFRIGVGQVIKGWDEGMLGACVGEQRRLTIPSEKGYGARGYPGAIPAGATLVFNVELISIGDEEEL